MSEKKSNGNPVEDDRNKDAFFFRRGEGRSKYKLPKSKKKRAQSSLGNTVDAEREEPICESRSFLGIRIESRFWGSEIEDGWACIIEKFFFFIPRLRCAS